MKSLIIYLITFTICTSAFPQNIIIPKDSLDKIIQGTFNKIMEDKSYTRIPNTQFDDIMVQKISGTIDDKFKNIYWYVGVIGFILGSLLFYSGNKYLKDAVQSKFDKESTAIKSKFDMELATIQKSLLSTLNEGVQQIQKDMEDKLKEVKTKLENSTAQIEDAKKEILNIRIEKIQNELTNRKVSEETFKSLMKSLNESENMINNPLTENILFLLSLASYELKKQTEMEKLVQTYMQKPDIKMNAAVFLNLASGFFYNYHTTQDLKDKTKCLLYVNESLKALPYYGEAYGLKLELLMLDHSHTTDTDIAERQKIMNEAKLILELCENSPATATEFIKRLNRVGVSGIEEKCTKLLYSLFPTEMNALNELAKKDNPVEV